MSAVQLVRLHRISDTFGFASVRLTDVHLQGLKVERQTNGSLRVTPPSRKDKDGRDWPTYAIQPGALEAVHAEIARLWALSR